MGWLNVDKYENCKPDLVLDLEDIPWPFDDGWFSEIYASHVFEHFKDYWSVFLEATRVLHVGGELEIWVSRSLQ